jgi:hypothetical protein
MRVSKAISVVCSALVLSLVTAVLFVAAGCGFRVSTQDFPVLRLSNETPTAQEAERH